MSEVRNVRERIQIGIVCGGDPRSSATWSGTPSGLISGFEQTGAEVVVIDTEIAAWVRRALAAPARLRFRDATVANRRPALAWTRGRAVRERVRRRRSLDAVIALTTELYDVDFQLPWATYDDMTHEQARRSPYSELNWYPKSQTAAWAARQARACRRASICFATTDWAARSIRDDYGVPPERIEVVGVGAARVAARHVERDWSKPSFLFVGKDWERKNGVGVLRAFRAVKEAFPNARLDVVGGHPPLDQPGVTGHGDLPLDDPGAQAEVDRLFEHATCLVLPSHLEPSAVVHVEAAQAGLPSIGTTEGGVSALIGDGGMLVDPTDEQGLIDAMVQIADPNRARDLGALARAHISSLSWQKIAERMLAVLANHAQTSVRAGDSTAP
jgi:glycogen synthase